MKPAEIARRSRSCPRMDRLFSGGYRYGGLESSRAGLPASATTLRSKPTDEGELENDKTLENFAAYPERAKSIGKPLPPTIGKSKPREAARRRIEELAQKERTDKAVP